MKKHGFSTIAKAFSIFMAAFTLLCGNAHAAFPDHPITIVVPFGAGSGTDALARSLGKSITEITGQAVVIDNKAGAGGIIGVSAVAHSTADGYTLLFATSGPLAANPSLYSKLPYDPEKDFEPISIVGRRPLVLIGSKMAKSKTFDGLVAEAKANPGAVNFGASNTTARVFVELLKKSSNIAVEPVLYKDVGAMMTDLMGGQISYSFEDAGPSLPLIESGKINLIAVASAKRVAFTGNAPAIGEYGMKDYGLSTWYGLFAPKNTPPAILEQLAVLMAKVVKSPDVVNFSRQVGIELQEPTSTKEMKIFHHAEVEKWKELVNITGVKLD